MLDRHYVHECAANIDFYYQGLIKIIWRPPHMEYSH